MTSLTKKYRKVLTWHQVSPKKKKVYAILQFCILILHYIWNCLLLIRHTKATYFFLNHISNLAKLCWFGLQIMCSNIAVINEHTFYFQRVFISIQRIFIKLYLFWDCVYDGRESIIIFANSFGRLIWFWPFCHVSVARWRFAKTKPPVITRNVVACTFF